ncbi:MAG TPA: helix-turn-helix domain-containing protein [Pirellulales bacterium]|nr:helix-turn-helix domain-containing protein [Pirellulales bacterium]
MTVTLDDVLAKVNELLERSEFVGKRFLSVEEAARYCSISAESVRRMISAGKLVSLNPVRGRVVIDKQQLDAVVLGSAQQLRGGRGRMDRHERSRRTAKAQNTRSRRDGPAGES